MPRNARALCGLVWSCFAVTAMGQVPAEKPDKQPTPRGVTVHEPSACPGYTLISPFSNETAYLLDLDGRVVHTWKSNYEPGLAPYLLPNGHLLRGIQMEVPVPFEGGGQSGGLQEFSRDGELLWEFHLASNLALHHHDIDPLPDGNVLMVAWEGKTRHEALEAGRLPSWCGERGMWPCFVVEIEPLRPFGARVVWEWHAWDHLIQDVDTSLPHYGAAWEHPERVNINGDIPRAPGAGAELTAGEQADRQALGYLAGDSEDLDDEERRRRERADWLHINAVDYHPELDQIALSVFHMHEIWIIDHSTTTEEAASSSGGRHGRGGDLLYRWGNPQTYQLGTEEDRKLFHQHDVQWIPDGHPGAGNLTVFNNGRRRPGEEYSTVLEIEPPLRADGRYAREETEAFGPAEPVWEYDPSGEERFLASFISGAHRLPNGNTLICSGPQGRVFEVNRDQEIVWELLNPFGKARGEELEEFTYGMFRATRLPPDHPGLRGMALAPLDPQPKTAEELFAERPEPGPQSSGWQPLFDEEMGLSRWVNVNCAEGSTFEVRPDPDDEDETILHCTGKPTGILRSDRMYENFLLELEWRHMDEPGNAGFFVWADPLPAVGGPFTRGIEVQVCNLGNGTWFTSHGDIFPIWGAVMTPDPRFRISGSRSMPKEDAFHARPTGEWNHYRITAVDGALTLEVNGHLVTAGSQCSPSRGYLCLESEGGEVHFRNLRIWELPDGTHAADASRTAMQATGHRTLYSGIDLHGWEMEQGQWQSEDWRLTAGKGDARIRAALPDGTRHVFFDFKRPDVPDTGKLPFALGEHRFDATGEVAEKWNRVHVRLEDDQLTVECGESHQRQAFDRTLGVLTLVNDGLATEFCSLFAGGTDER